MIAETAAPALHRQPQLASGIDLLTNGFACCAFIVWYLERSRVRTEEEMRAAAEDITRAVYTVAFADGADSERAKHGEQPEEDGGSLVDLDAHRSTDHGMNGTAARPSSHGSR